MSLTLTIDTKRASRAFKKAPELLIKQVGNAVHRSLLEMSRTERKLVAKDTSQLANSIQVERFDKGLSGRVAVGAEHGSYVEKGTGPGGVPSNAAILKWIDRKGITPNNPFDTSKEDLAFLIRRKIFTEGTPKQPFAEPAFAQHKNDAISRVNRAVDKVLASAS